jgi:hypothetical protein
MKRHESAIEFPDKRRLEPPLCRRLMHGLGFSRFAAASVANSFLHAYRGGTMRLYCKL